MAKFLTFDKKQMNPAGLLPLRRGDDWKLRGKIIDRYAKYEASLDLTGSAATAFFQSATGGTLAKSVTLIDEAAGIVEIDMSGTGYQNTTEVALAEDGGSLYTTFQLPAEGLVTIEMDAPVLEIRDRHFSEP